MTTVRRANQHVCMPLLCPYELMVVGPATNSVTNEHTGTPYIHF